MEDKTQNIWAEYSTLPPPSVQLRRFDDGRDNRFYWWVSYNEEAQIIPNTAIGITSLLGMVMPTSPFMTQWKLDNPNWEQLFKDSSVYGTILHQIYGEWIVKRTVNDDLVQAARAIAIRTGGGSDMIDKNIISFMKWVEDYNVKPLLCEAMLLSAPIEGEQYALTLDLLCELSVEETVEFEKEDGVYVKGDKKGQPKIIKIKETSKVKRLALVDFKSNFFDKDKKSFYDSHLMQLIGARKAIKHSYPDLNVDIIANLSPSGWRTKPGYDFYIWEPTWIEEALFDSYITIARLKGMFQPKGSIFMPPIYNANANSSDFRIVSYPEYVLGILTPPEDNREDYTDEFSPILNSI
jgi:hypothetical protein